jgi:pyroglutamyl-peptidase
MTRLLLTGFEPFGTATSNPSGEIVKQISGDSIVTAILPVTYALSAERLLELIAEHNPDVVICLGQAEGRTQITPEKVAINLDDARLPDNAGVQRSDVKILDNGPDAYFTTLPIKEMVDAAKAADVPASVSLSAGAFLCNHVFYIAQNKFAGSKVRSGFIHVPLMDSQAPEFPGLPTMPLNQMIKAVRAMLEVL